MKMGEEEIHVSGNRLTVGSHDSCAVNIDVIGLDWCVVGINGEALLAPFFFFFFVAILVQFIR